MSILKLEYSKETLRNTCIFVRSNTHAKKVIKFYESYGFQNKITQIPKAGWYISAVDFILQNDILLADAICYTSLKKLSEIKLPVKPRRKFPREMMVSDDLIHWNKRTVVAKIKTKWPVIALKINFDLKDEFIEYRSWKYAKEID